MRGPLIGRAAELGAIHDAIARSRRQHLPVALLVIGEPGSGKSHLAAIWAGTAGARSLAARSIGTASLPAAFATGALVLEDLAEGRFDECALFHLINAAREERAFVLITARSAPAAWNIAVPDLASRLRVLATLRTGTRSSPSASSRSRSTAAPRRASSRPRRW